MATLHNIYTLQCTSCSLDFESLGKAKEYDNGKPLCMPCYDRQVGQTCETHFVYHCAICKAAQKAYKAKKVTAATSGDLKPIPLQYID